MYRSPRATGARRRLIAPFGVALSALAFLPAAAAAAPVTYTFPGDASVKVTFDTDAVVANSTARQIVTFKGEGFHGINPGEGKGVPVFALKWDDQDDFRDWGPLKSDGTPDEVAQRTEIEEPAVASFTTVDGKVEGWVELPQDIARTGPGTGGNAGRHFFRMLSGAFSTTGVNTDNNKNVTAPITYQGWVTARGPLAVGFTAPSGVFTEGTTWPASSAFGIGLTAKGIGFGATKDLSITSGGVNVTPGTQAPGAADGVLLPGTRPKSDAGGAFSFNVSLPAAAAGDSVISVTDGTITRNVTIKRVAHTATLDTPQVGPQGTVVARITGFVGIGGAGQKVAMVFSPSDKVIGCADTDAGGNATLTGTLPADVAAGTYGLRFNSGTACVVANGVVQPVPRGAFLQNALSVSAAAPAVSSTTKAVSVGATLPVTGVNFAPGASITPTLDGTPVGAPIVADDGGKLTGTITIPAGATPGTRVITVGTAVLSVKVYAAAKATITTSGSVQAGSAVAFTLSGFVRTDGTAGQKVGVRVNTGPIQECIQTDADGNGSGTIMIPATTEGGEQIIRFLAGSSCVSGSQNDLPSRSLTASVQVTAVTAETPAPVPAPTAPAVPLPAPSVVPVPTPSVVPTPTPTPAPTKLTPPATKAKVDRKLTAVTFSLAQGARDAVKVSVKTKSKVRLTSKGKAKIVTVVKTKTVTPKGRSNPTIKLTLTADGRKLLKARRSLKVVVTLTVAGGKSVEKTFTLKP